MVDGLVCAPDPQRRRCGMQAATTASETAAIACCSACHMSIIWSIAGSHGSVMLALAPQSGGAQRAQRRVQCPATRYVLTCIPLLPESTRTYSAPQSTPPLPQAMPLPLEPSQILLAAVLARSALEIVGIATRQAHSLRPRASAAAKPLLCRRCHSRTTHVQLAASALILPSTPPYRHLPPASSPAAL